LIKQPYRKRFKRTNAGLEPASTRSSSPKRRTRLRDLQMDSKKTALSSLVKMMKTMR
jgi:hypothetical protein